MILDRILFCRSIALSFRGDNVEEIWPPNRFCGFDRSKQYRQVMAIDRTEIVEAQFFE